MLKVNLLMTEWWIFGRKLREVDSRRRNWNQSRLVSMLAFLFSDSEYCFEEYRFLSGSLLVAIYVLLMLPCSVAFL